MDRSSDDRLSIEVARALLQGLGTPEQAMAAVDQARQGKHVPALAGRSPEDLGLLDRLAWGRVASHESGRPQALLEGLLGVAPYEAAKGMAQSGIPGLSHIGELGLKLGGQAVVPGQAGADAMQINETTSPASMKNVLAFFAGALDKPGEEEEELKKRQVAEALLPRPGVPR